MVLSIKKLCFPTGRGVVRRGFGRSELDRQPPRHAQLPQPLEGPLEADPELAAHPGAADEPSNDAQCRGLLFSHLVRISKKLFYDKNK